MVKQNEELDLIKREQRFYLFLISYAYFSTIFYGIFYYFITGISELTIMCIVTFSFYIIYGSFSFFAKRLLTLFRLSVLTALLAFYYQVFFTGGSTSGVMAQFIIPTLLTYFYRPSSDRYFFLVLSGLSITSMWPLTHFGYTVNLIPEEWKIASDTIGVLYSFIIVSIYLFLYRKALSRKNQKLNQSLNELKETTQMLVQSEKMASLGIMSAGVAHEINNPLNFIKGGIDILSGQLKDKKDTQQVLKAIDEGVKRMSSIVDSMGHFSRNTSSSDEECDLHKIVDNCLIMLQHKLKYRINVVKDYEVSNNAIVTGNSGKLHQAILNILSNAEQAIEKSGEIRIETRNNEKNLRLTISDDGDGIAHEDLLRIADPFFTTKPVGKGTGLGLAISYRIIEEHKGKVIVASEKGMGTQFTILFDTV